MSSPALPGTSLTARTELGAMATIPALRAVAFPLPDSSHASALNAPQEPVDTPDPVLPTLISDSATPVLPPRSDLPIIFPGYEILGELGRGGMGVVYKARQRSLNRLLALKVILAGPHASDADKARFRLEAEAGARLKHPNIVQVFDVGEHAGFAFIAFELVEGQTLRQWQGEQPADPHDAVRIMIGLARAIHHAHQAGIIHRDIKPANVLLAPASGSGVRRSDSRTVSLRDPSRSRAPRQLDAASTSRSTQPAFQPKLTDFGLAKSLEGGLDLTITGMACGTPHYMAPEQVKGRAIGTPADVYGLGAVLYELLTGRPPFKGPDAAQVMDKILRSDPERVRRVNSQVPRDLEVITAKCLEKDPARRYESAAALVEDLERFLEGRPISARPVSFTERSWRWCRRNPVVATFLVLSSVACLTTGQMALALAKSVKVERQARAEMERAHQIALDQQKSAVRARDELQIALEQEATARKLAFAEKEAADGARAEAMVARTQADGEKLLASQQRDRANSNLRLVRAVVRNTFNSVEANPHFAGPEFRETRTNLLKIAATFYKEFSEQAGSDPDALLELVDCGMMMGYLEHLNGNNAAAARHYEAVTGVCERWATVDPEDPEPRIRQAFALQNAGNAHCNARQYEQAEKCYRSAIGLFLGVVKKHPKVESYLSRLVLSYPPLYEHLRDQQRWSEGAAVCREYLNWSKELVNRGRPKTAYLLSQARAAQCLGQMLDRTNQAADAEQYFLEAVSIREQIRLKHGWDVEQTVEAGRLHHAFAQHDFIFMQNPQKGAATATRAIDYLERAYLADPRSGRNGLDLVEVCILDATIAARNNDLKRALQSLDRAIRVTELVLAQKPTLEVVPEARAAWVKALRSRAMLLMSAGLHSESSKAWEVLAKDDPDIRERPNHGYFALLTLTASGDWRAASERAEKLAATNPPPNILCDIGKMWCRIAKQIEVDDKLTEAERKQEIATAHANALAILERAKKTGLFKDPEVVKYFESQPDFDPIRKQFNVAE